MVRQKGVLSKLYFALSRVNAPNSSRRTFASGVVRQFWGFTTSHKNAPNAHNVAATRNEAVQPNWAATAGVSDAVSIPPSCAPMFMKPDTEPDDEPARPAVTDQ